MCNHCNCEKPMPGTGGMDYVPYEQRIGNESIVYFTRQLSAQGLIKAYEQVCAQINGHVGVKLHTGEQHGPNIIPREWVKALMEKTYVEPTLLKQTLIMRVTVLLRNCTARL